MEAELSLEFLRVVENAAIAAARRPDVALKRPVELYGG